MNWISNLLASSSTKISVNGALSPIMIHRRGLRQGDPLSSLLFVLVMDCLGRLFEAAHRAGIFSLLGSLLIQHRTSLYADDAILFIKPEPNEVIASTLLLDTFGQATGLNCNLAKSSIIPIRCDEIDLTGLLTPLPSRRTQFPCTYLGMPLKTRSLRKGNLQPMIDKLAKRASGWHGKFFSSSEKLAFVRHVLSAIPIFQLMVGIGNKWAEAQLNKLRRSFFWAGSDEVSVGRCLMA